MLKDQITDHHASKAAHTLVIQVIMVQTAPLREHQTLTLPTLHVTDVARPATTQTAVHSKAQEQEQVLPLHHASRGLTDNQTEILDLLTTDLRNVYMPSQILQNLYRPTILSRFA
jgi:hypothetical protein